MPTPISLTDCPGLIDLMLTGEELGPSFTLNGVQCDVAQVESHACFEAVTPDFGLSVIYPGWYAGEHGAPAHVIIAGDPIACTRWLPMGQKDRRAIIDRLPLSSIDRALCKTAA